MDLSPFGRLPAEIRNKIYELCFEADYKELRDRNSAVCLDNNNFRKCISLTQTCRLMRQENRAMFWCGKSLYKDIDCVPSAWSLCRLLKILGPGMLSIMRGIKLKIHSPRRGNGARRPFHFERDIEISFCDHEYHEPLKEPSEGWLPARKLHYNNWWAYDAQFELVSTLARMEVKVDDYSGLQDVYHGEERKMSEGRKRKTLDDEAYAEKKARYCAAFDTRVLDVARARSSVSGRASFCVPKVSQTRK